MRRRIGRALLVVFFCFACAAPAVAGETICTPEGREKADALYQEARKEFAEMFDEATARASAAKVEQATALCPDFEEAWAFLSWLDWEVGDRLPRENKAERMGWFARGEAAGDRALELNPDSAPGLYWKTVNMASTADMKGWMSSLWLYPTLRKNMDRVDALQPHYFYGTVPRYWCEVLSRVPLFLAGRFGMKVEDVEAMLEDEIRREPRYFANYVYAARLLWKMKERDRAFSHLDTVLRGDPGLLPSDAGDNASEQRIAREMWKTYTGRDHPDR